MGRVRLFIVCGLLTLMFAPVSGRAETISYKASASGPLAAQADFTTSAGQITVTLTNLLSLADFKSPGQGLSDITFTLSNAPGTLGTTSAAGQFGDIDKNGKVTYVSSDSQGKLSSFTTPQRWFIGDNTGISGNTFTLETIGGKIGGKGIGQPSEMIAPFLANGGTYTSANNGVANFNSWVIGPATFTLNLSGVTADTKVTAVTFSFGTSPDTFVPGVPVPEPASIVMALTAFGAFGVARLRRRHQKPADAVA